MLNVVYFSGIMLLFIQKNLLLSFLFCKVALNFGSPVIKRSPLELGFVTFPDVENPKRLILFNKTNTEMNLNGISEDEKGQRRRIFDHEWIPGKVRHHSYIPAHIHHLYLPVVLTKTVLVKSPYEYYPRLYGGFGAGSFSGGQGAGHGFQIVFHDNV